MGKNTTNPTMPKKFNIPIPTTPSSSRQFQLPYQGTVVSDGGFSFSFAAFDRSHKLFNLGDDTERSGVVCGKWFIDLLDCLKNISKMTVSAMKTSMHDLHPVDWEKANATIPNDSKQCDYWQFRINKSKGRIIGVLTDSVFYVVWLDPHHNLSDSEGYGTTTYHYRPKSTYESMQEKIDELQQENTRLNEELKAAEDLIAEK